VPPIAPAEPDFSSLERHLLKITSQIEALQRPDGIEQSIAAFRAELSEIRLALTEAMPRRAIESIENEVRSLARRIEDNRQSAVDGQAMANIERALSEIHQVLGSLTSAEQLAGYDEAIRNLGAKLDMILRANDDPRTMHQLESAISSLRGIVSNVASTDALARLSEDVRLLSSKVDQITRDNNPGDSFAALEQRIIASLTSALEGRERPAAPDTSEQLEAALRALSDRIDRMQVGNDGAAAFAHLEQRVSYLLERLDASSDPQAGHLGRVEDGLQNILRHLEKQHAAFAVLAESGRHAPPQAPDQTQDTGLIDLVKRELSDIRFSQTEAGRHTQDSLEAVHSTLGHVVDRLAMIEGDLRAPRPVSPEPAPPAASAPIASPPLAPMPIAPEQDAIAPVIAAPPQQKPELPNPAAAQAPFAAAPRDFHAATPATEPEAPPPLPAPPRVISEILEPHAAKAARPAITPELPPDHPLEPGTRPNGRVPSPSERIAASEDAISEIPAAPRQPVSSSSFIAAARRAAQAAAAAPPPEKGSRPAKAAAGQGKDSKEPSTITTKVRSVLVAASVVVIVLGTFKMAMTLLDGGGSNPPPMPAAENSAEPQPAAKSPANGGDKPATPDQVTPSMTSPTPLGRQSLNNMQPTAPDPAASVDVPQGPASSALANDITGSIAASQAASTGRRFGTVQVPPSEKLPDTIAGPALRAAALKGDATAAYEIATRFADGKGVAQNLDEAAKWFDRAAQAGVVPAIFRLGTFYEKGLSVKKDADIARRYYLQAAERGNAKAMHNLAVLDADGGGKGANYKSAVQWFRKAADRGIADSQFNLGILYARGIGVEQNLAESFKWFSLAAAQGDADSATKRDDVAKRMDAQSLAAAKLAIQTFIAEPQPEDAVIVATPPGGWDGVPSQAATATKPAAKLGPKRTALVAH
jgi:localization factor PodJL